MGFLRRLGGQTGKRYKAADGRARYLRFTDGRAVRLTREIPRDSRICLPSMARIRGAQRTRRD
jgi:hypothetical protein